MGSSEIFGLRKQGRSAEALEMARAEFPENTNDIWFLRAYAWALYDKAKEIVDAHEQKHLSPAALTAQLTPCMREFARIAKLLRKDSAFSQMLRLALKVSRDWPEFLGVARWAGLDDFAEEDKRPFVNDQQKTIDSLQKRFTRAICREAAAKAVESHQDAALIDWGLSILSQGLSADPGDQWLNYYQSKVHMAQGQLDLAIERLMPVLRRQPRAAWPWALLGEILEDTRPSDALTCYANAVRLAREEQEVAKTRIRLAHRLALDSRFNEAAMQASVALAYREHHGFRVPQELAQLLASDWYQEVEAKGGQQHLPDVDAAIKALLDELNRSSLTYITGAIDHINAEKALSFVVTGVDDGFALMHRRFPEVAALSPGTVVEVARAGPHAPPVHWRLSEVQSLAGLCESFSGTIDRHADKNFAWIRAKPEDIFVPSALAQTIEPGQRLTVTCVAIKRANKQGKIGWRAVRFVDQQSIPSFVLTGVSSALGALNRPEFSGGSNL